MLAFLFPGQGSQTVGMGKAVADQFPVAKRTFDEADAALGEGLSKLCWEGPSEKLALTANAQPAILTNSIAMLRVVQQETGLVAGVAAGHSLGEYSALVAAGAIAFADGVRLVRKRGQFMQEAVPEGVGAMAAVMGMERKKIEDVCRACAEGQVLVAANYNGAVQTVVSGHKTAVARAVKMIEDAGGTAKMLNVSAPFHSPLMVPAGARLKTELAAVTVSPQAFAVLSNLTAQPHGDASAIRDLLVEQVSAPVQWEECSKRLASMGVKQVLELGGDTLIKLVKRIVPGLGLQAFAQLPQLEQVKQHAATDWKGFVGQAAAPAEQEWIVKKDGTKVSKDGTHYIWPDGTEWRYQPTA